MASQRRRRVRSSAARPYSSPACYLHELPAAAQRTAARNIHVKRIHEEPGPEDGFRVLVDRLWPRGISRQRAALDEWLQELAPSSALRRWFHQDPTRWTQFVRRYRAELRTQQPALEALRQRAAQQRVTLLFASREVRRNHAIVLRELLRES